MRGDDPQDSASFFRFLVSNLTEEWERLDNPDRARGRGKERKRSEKDVCSNKKLTIVNK